MNILFTCYFFVYILKEIQYHLFKKNNNYIAQKGQKGCNNMDVKSMYIEDIFFDVVRQELKELGLEDTPDSLITNLCERYQLLVDETENNEEEIKVFLYDKRLTSSWWNDVHSYINERKAEWELLYRHYGYVD